MEEYKELDERDETPTAGKGTVDLRGGGGKGWRERRRREGGGCPGLSQEVQSCTILPSLILGEGGVRREGEGGEREVRVALVTILSCIITAGQGEDRS